MNKRLERNQEYDVKLTGEEIVLIAYLLAHCNSSLLTTTYRKLDNFILNEIIERTSPLLATIELFQKKGELRVWLDAVFPPIETEDQRKLRELKEQYAKLGDSIAAMENVSK